MAHVRRPGNHSARIAIETLEDRTTPAAGFLDPTFGTGGIAITALPLQGTFNADAEAHAIAVQPDGKIVIAGSTPNLTVTPGTDDLDMFVARLNPDGTPDTSFGSGGRVQIPFQGGGNNFDEANAVVIQPDGRIVVGGYATFTASGQDFALVRLLSNGALDPTFGSGGKDIFTNPANDIINALTLQPDGKIVAAGQSFSVTGGFTVVRFNANGSADGSFGSGGRANVVLNDAFDAAHGVALEGNKIVVVGTLSLSADLGAARFNADGTLDGSFASGGKFQAGLSGGTGGGVAIQPDGKIVLVGGGAQAASGTQPATNGRDLLAIRLNQDGSRDTTFGGTGGVLVGVDLTNSGANDDAIGVVIEPGGKIVLGGMATGSPTEYASARLLPNGSLDPTWAVGGVGHYYVGTQSYIFNPIQAFALTRNLDGTVLLAGTNSTEAITLRLTSDTSGGGGGVPPTLGGGVLTSLFAAATDGPQLAAFTNGGVGPFNPNAPVSPNLAAIFPGFTGVVRSAIGDVDGDGIPDFALVTGPGTATMFAVVSGADLTSYVIPPTFPFRGSESFTGGGFITVGSVDGSGRADVIVTPDQSGGPRVVVFSAAGTNQPPIVRADFFGIADPNFRGGARTAVGDLNGDGVPDLAVAAGAGGGARVAVYDGTSVLTTRTKLLGDFFAFEPGLHDGVFLAIGDVNADGFGDLVVGAGSGGGPRIRVVSGKTLTQSGAIIAFGLPIADFFVGNNGSTRGGVRVAVKNVDNDNNADIIAASGEGQPGDIRVYSGVNVAGRAEPFVSQEIPLFGTDPLPDGIFVG